jgi:hypothetical protein
MQLLEFESEQVRQEESQGKHWSSLVKELPIQEARHWEWI